MDVLEYIDILDEQGQMLAKAADGADLEYMVPTCPEWNLRDLLLHVGRVHRWATSYVAGARETMLPEDEVQALFEAVPASDEKIVEWFREGHGALCDALRAAPIALECWTFLPAPSPLAFWARRQAHETTMHRVDTEQVSGALTPPAGPFSSDGVDELLVLFAARGKKLLSDPPLTLAVEATDTGDNWLLNLGTERVDVERTTGAADCTVRGTASDLYLTLWNRLPTSVLITEGDHDVLDGFCNRLHVR
jgi:uncharacterized protein (TIGR03083 family)